jgi:hypothetical protein
MAQTTEKAVPAGGNGSVASAQAQLWARFGRNALIRWARIALAGVIAAALPAATLAQTADKPSFFGSLWSSIKGGTSADGAEAPTPSKAPSLSSARWIGFTPVLVAGPAAGEGIWVAGPFAETDATGWVTDTVSGLTVQARLVWRDAAEGSLAELSAEAGKGLGLTPGAVANVAIYLAR